MIELIQGDITTLAVDAIVNAANEAFRGGGGVDGAIHRAAGSELLRECETHPSLPAGRAILTRGYRLPARYVIHTVGPVWRGGSHGERRALGAAYDSAFAVARAHPDIRSIAFPAISTGIYGYPPDEAAEVALDAMRRHERAFERIVACLFSERDLEIYRNAERLRAGP
jgi:O-acetyl-ADP-ribose deacetylase (regulator of RNase III)